MQINVSVFQIEKVLIKQIMKLLNSVYAVIFSTYSIQTLLIAIGCWTLFRTLIECLSDVAYGAGVSFGNVNLMLFIMHCIYNVVVKHILYEQSASYTAEMQKRHIFL